MTQKTEPRFGPGDRVVIARQGGRAAVWKVVRVETNSRDPEPAYELAIGNKRRSAVESALALARQHEAPDAC